MGRGIRLSSENDLVPDWLFPGEAKIERIATVRSAPCSCKVVAFAPHPQDRGRRNSDWKDLATKLRQECVGQVMSTLDKLGLTENTLVIFSSDK